MKTGTVINLAVLAGLGFVGYKLYEGVSGAGSYVAQVASHVSDALGETAANLVIGDTNAQVQSQFQDVMAALKAAGSPAVGTPQYNAVLAQFGMPPAPAPVGG